PNKQRTLPPMIFVSSYHSCLGAFFDVRFSALSPAQELIIVLFNNPGLICAGHRPAIRALFFCFPF
ncbi:MAG: hypothetical protein WBI31_05170, partial [Thermacetogeniaceae bacterium]